MSSDEDPWEYSRFASINIIFFDVSFVASTSLMPLMLYSILYKSGTIGKYRWYMLNNILCDYAYDVGLALIRPIMLPKAIGGYALPPIPLSHSQMYLAVEMGCWMLDFICIGVVLSLFYRYSQAFPGWLQHFFDNTYWVYLAYAAFYGITVPTMVVAMYLHRMDSEEEVRRYLFGDDSSGPTTHSIFAYAEGSDLRLALWYMSALLFVMFLVGVTLFTVLYFRISNPNSTFTVARRLQRMLFRACVVQFAVGLMFLLFPMLITAISMIYEPPFTEHIANGLLILTSMHSVAEFVGILYFITPYRRFVIELFNKVFRRNRGTAGVIRVSPQATLHTVTRQEEI